MSPRDDLIRLVRAPIPSIVLLYALVTEAHQAPVARLRLVTRPMAAKKSMKSLVGLNWRSMPNSDAA